MALIRSGLHPFRINPSQSQVSTLHTSTSLSVVNRNPSRELEGGSPLQEFDKKSRNILPKFGILIENLPNDSCILTGDFDRFFKRSDRFLIRSFMLQKWYHVDPRQTAVTVVPFRQHKAPD